VYVSNTFFTGGEAPREPPAYGIVFCLKTEMRTRRRLCEPQCRRRGALGGEAPHKIEMFFDSMVDCSFKKNTHTTSTCQDRQRAKDRKCLTSFSKQQKARQKKHQNKKQNAKKNVQSKTPNTQHPMRHSWQHTEQHTQCKRLQQDRLTKKRAKRGLTDNQEQTASLTTGLPTSKENENTRERRERREKNSKFNNR